MYTKDKRAFVYTCRTIGDRHCAGVGEGSKDDSVVCHSTTIADDDDDETLAVVSDTIQ
jgi:hypothetical protein